MLLVLVATYAGMWLAAGGPAPIELTLITLLGTGLASAASGTLNNYIDRDVDKLMARTRNRALPSGRLPAINALFLGLMLTGISFLILAFFINLLTAILALSTILFYVCIYTRWLKRTSPSCTEIGGIAGALPPLIGWAAVHNEIGAPAAALFLIMFLWQPPHFWALALLKVEDYRRAGLPMLPVALGQTATLRRSVFYAAATLVASGTLYSMNAVGTAYLVVAMILGIIFVALTVELAVRPFTPQRARRLFQFSLYYLTLLFVMIFLDTVSVGGAPT